MTILPDKQWFRISEAAELLGCCKQTIYNAIQSGELEAAGNKYYLRVSRHSLLRKFFTD
jgi:excisionase family DNA binding protein